MWRQICLVLVILILGSISTIYTVQAESPENVRETLKVFQSWLTEDNNSRDWNEFLKTKTLQQELDKGKHADRQVVEEILGLYSSQTPGLDNRHFFAVRESLDQWLTTLSLPDVDELPHRIREAKSRFIPSAAGSVEQTRLELSQFISQLEQFLASGGRKKELGWKEYLRWDEMQNILTSEDGPDLKKLEQIQKLFFEDFKGLDLPAFVAVRRALRKYAESVVYSNEKFQAQFATAVESLAQGIEVYPNQPSHQNAATIAFLLGTFERSGQLPDLVSAVRHHYSKPNYYVQISGPLVGLGFDETVDDKTPMKENRDGARVTGTVNTTGEIVSRLVPNVHEGEIEIQLLGNAQADTRTVSGPATIIASSVTSIDVRKTLFFSDEGIRGTEASANCETDISIEKVLGSPTVISRARPKIRAKLPRSKFRTARATEQRMSRELEKTVAEAVTNANHRYQQQFKTPLMRRDEHPGKMNFSTTENFLLGQMAQANSFQIAALDRPPKSLTGLDLAIQIHQSYVNNYVEAVYGGTKLTDKKMAQIAGEIMDTVPERFQHDENAEPWSITFPRRKPLTVIFADGGYTVVIRGRRYTSGDRSLGAWHVTAKYRFEMLPEGLRRIRQGDLDIKPANFTQRSNHKLSITEVAEKNILQRRFSELFSPVIEPEKMELAGQWKTAKKLIMKQLTAEGGWLVMGWQQSKQFEQTITQTAEVSR